MPTIPPMSTIVIICTHSHTHTHSHQPQLPQIPCLCLNCVTLCRYQRFTEADWELVNAIDEKELTTKLLIKILNKHLMTAMNRLYRTGEDWKLLWDNAIPHTSHDMQVWLRSGSTKVVTITAHSPDLNITENFWSDFERRVEKHN